MRDVVREYTHFVVMKNDFPYTRVARDSHMLSPRRHVASIYDLTSDELAELHTIITAIETGDGDYDQIIKSTFKNMSIPSHVHLHLIRFKVTP
jgi:diadenosine tetraphosphate (Ap4A) HIT family hydrolase